MTDKNKALYFVALIPKEPIRSEIQNLKLDVWEKFNSKGALRSPAHITLHMPFQYREEKQDEIFQCLDQFSINRTPFEITQNGFGCFEPRVIFVNVEKSDSLQELRNDLVKHMRLSLKLENADYKNQGFHPHMTIAFRDLKKAVFPIAWKHFKNQKIEYSWECHSIFLLKHTGKEWEIFREFDFS